jgi:nucleoside-diphosphate-sugar epimerase
MIAWRGASMRDRNELDGKRVLVTGASGFIGSHLVTALAAAGAEVLALSRYRRDTGGEPGRVRWRRCNLGAAAELHRLMAEERPEVVYHLASHVSGVRDPEAVLPTFTANLESTVHLLLAAQGLGPELTRVVLAGSLEEPADEDPGAVPCSPYAAAKWAAAGYARMFHALYDLPVTVARLFMVYGPGQADHAKLVPYVTLALLKGETPRLGSGTRPVDWVYVGDVVAALLAAATAPAAAGAAVDVGSGELHTVRQVVEVVRDLAAPGASLVFGTVADRPLERVRAAEVGATAELLGWRPRTSLAEGLEHTVAWYRRSVAEGR